MGAFRPHPAKKIFVQTTERIFTLAPRRRHLAPCERPDVDERPGAFEAVVPAPQRPAFLLHVQMTDLHILFCKITQEDSIRGVHSFSFLFVKQVPKALRS